MILVCRNGARQVGRIVLDQTRAIAIAGFGILFVLRFQLCRLAEILDLLGAVVAFAFRSFRQILCLLLGLFLCIQRRRQRCAQEENENANRSLRDHFAPLMISSIAVSSMGFNSMLQTCSD